MNKIVCKKAPDYCVSFESLIASIKKFGLLNPIIIDKKFNLIEGYYRLKAVKQLKFKTIYALVLK